MSDKIKKLARSVEELYRDDPSGRRCRFRRTPRPSRRGFLGGAGSQLRRGGRRHSPYSQKCRPG